MFTGIPNLNSFISVEYARSGEEANPVDAKPILFYEVETQRSIKAMCSLSTKQKTVINTARHHTEVNKVGEIYIVGVGSVRSCSCAVDGVGRVIEIMGILGEHRPVLRRQSDITD